MVQIGDKVRIAPKVWDDVKKEWTHKGKENNRYYGVVCTVRSLGVIPTVKILANTNAGYWWIGVDYDEMEKVDDDAELTIMGVDR